MMAKDKVIKGNRLSHIIVHCIGKLEVIKSISIANNLCKYEGN